MIPNEIRTLTDAFFNAHKTEYNFEEVEDCGRYMEALIPHVQANGYPLVGFLKYTGSGTKYNNHRIDSFLYKDTTTVNGLLQSCDVIANAETDHASAGWSPDFPRYTESDWVKTLEELIGDDPVKPNTVPWVGYDENSFQELKKQLAYDYARRPQGADFDVTVWAARVFHSAYMGPEGTPLGLPAAIDKHTPEWCDALHVPVKKVPDGWNIGDPV